MSMSGLYPYTKRGLYRSRDGMIFGVCKGIANYLDLSVGWLRILTIIAFIVTGFFPTAVVYILAALVMKKEPYYYDY
jgi:phage shock protein C